MRPVSTIAAGVFLAALAVPTQAAGSPEGLWQSGPRDLIYELRYCGEGESLCGWLRYAADQTPEAQRHVGQLTLDTIRKTGPSQWEGSMVVAGHHASGKVVQVSDDKLDIDACVMFVVCGQFSLYRAD